MKPKGKNVGIIGIGSFVPDKILTNHDLEKMVDTSDEWILKRTGISERHLLEKDVPVFTMGVEAAKRAISDAGITADDIDMIIVTTSTPDYLTPSMSCLIQNGIGSKNTPAFDLNSACSGFIYGIATAKSMILSDMCKCVMVVGCEGLSKIVDWEDRNTCVLFGDGAGAVILGEVEEGFGIIESHLGADGNMGGLITIPCTHYEDADLEKRHHENKQVLWMDGSEVFKFAVRIVPYATEKVLEQAGMTLDDITLIVPHQANIRIIDGAAKRLNISEEKIYINISRFGNISSASVPVALDEVVKSGRIKKGDYFIIVGFGGGLTWGSSLIRWSK